MTFRAEIEITPDADGVHCGECKHRGGTPVFSDWCGLFAVWVRVDSIFSGVPDECKPRRCPACLAAEKAWREKQP